MRALIERLSSSPLALAILLIAVLAFNFSSSAESTGVPGPEIDCLKRLDGDTMVCRVKRVGMLAEPPWWTLKVTGRKVEIRAYVLEFKYPAGFEGVDVRYRVNKERDWRHQEGIVSHGQ